MKIPVTFTTLLFLVNLILCGQSIHSVSGMIRDEMGKPLPGANIYFPELEVGAVSDADGHFMIRNLPNGKFVLNISFIGYETDIRTIFFFRR